MFGDLKDRITGNKDNNNLEGLKLLNYYRNTYSTEEGISVLENQLKDFKYFSELMPTEEEVALHNAAIRLLVRLGILSPNNTRAIVEALMKLPVKLT